MEDADDRESPTDEEGTESGANGNDGRSDSGDSSEPGEPSDRWESEWSTGTSSEEREEEEDSLETGEDAGASPGGPGAGETATDDAEASDADTATDDAAETDAAPATDAETAPTHRQLSEADIREYTTDRRSLAPAVQLQWGFWTSISVVILTAILTGIVSFLRLDPRLGAVILVVLFVLAMAWISKRYDRWVYQVQADALYLERGVVTHVRTLVPYVRIQHVDTSRGPLERALGLSTLVVYTAGSRGADVSIPGLTPEEASDLQERVKELAIEAEGGDAL